MSKISADSAKTVCAVVFAGVAAGVYLFGGPTEDSAPDATDPVAEARAIVEQNMAKPCAAEMAQKSVVLLAQRDMQCP